MIALILAGGFAKRMGDVAKNCPKPLLEVAGRSVIDYILDKVEECPDVDRIIISTNAKFRENFNKWLSNARHRTDTRIVHEETASEEQKLGAVGALAWLVENEKISEDVMVINGDNLFRFNLQKFIELFRTSGGPVLGVYDIKSIDEAKRMGVVMLDSNGNICDFQEKPAEPKSTLISTGIYIFPAGLLGLFRQYLNEGNDRDRIGSFIAWLYKKHKVRAHVFMEQWYDIGTIETYEMVRKCFVLPHPAQAATLPEARLQEAMAQPTPEAAGARPAQEQAPAAEPAQPQVAQKQA
jgi:glucose-1-phosphate thymidylyltransferase